MRRIQPPLTVWIRLTSSARSILDTTLALEVSILLLTVGYTIQNDTTITAGL